MISELGVSTAQVSNCIKAGVFPGYWFDALDRLAEEDGWQISRSLFAWKQREDAA